jgi:serine protease Do
MDEFQEPTQGDSQNSGRKYRFLLLAALLAGFLGGILSPSVKPAETVQLAISRRQMETVPVQTGNVMTEAQVYAANVSATVGITTESTTNYWGIPTTSAASGSGFFLTRDGYVITNHHVVEGSDSITVSVYDGRSYEAVLVGSDARSDIALLKVIGEDFPCVVLGDSDGIRVGDRVAAIGNPLGELTFTLTAGCISATDRDVTFSRGVTRNLIQTDCAINSGNSGGALFNLYGEVIGVTNAKFSSPSGGASIDNIGFAIPINRVKAVVESILEKGYVSYPYLGITVADVSEEALDYGIPAGAAVQFVTGDSPADQAGLLRGDVITHAEGEPVDADRLVERIGKASPGDILTLTIYRQGNTLAIPITVGEHLRTEPE